MYFSIVDVVEVLTDASTPKRYWSDLKIKLKSEGNQTYENIVQLKMLASDGKERLDEYGDPELAFERMVRTYRQKGYSEEWIKQRLRSIDIRNVAKKFPIKGVATRK